MLRLIARGARAATTAAQRVRHKQRSSQQSERRTGTELLRVARRSLSSRAFELCCAVLSASDLTGCAVVVVPSVRRSARHWRCPRAQLRRVVHVVQQSVRVDRSRAASRVDSGSYPHAAAGSRASVRRQRSGESRDAHVHGAQRDSHSAQPKDQTKLVSRTIVNIRWSAHTQQYTHKQLPALCTRLGLSGLRSPLSPLLFPPPLPFTGCLTMIGMTHSACLVAYDACGTNGLRITPLLTDEHNALLPFLRSVFPSLLAAHVVCASLVCL